MLDAPRQLRPIGTERAHKKPQVSGFSIPEAGAAGLWTFNSGTWNVV